MPEYPLVSIVTPSYNQRRYLEETMQSVLLQDYPAIEYLLVDGGSTDGSVETIQRYAHRLSSWVSEPDAGQAAAINKGWQRARGDILAYLNSDDFYFPGTVRRAVEYLQGHPETGIVYGAEQLVDALGRPSGWPGERSEFSLKRLLRHPLPQPTMFFRRWVFQRIGWFDVSLHYTFDWDWNLRAAVAGVRIERLPGSPVAAFRCWGGQKTADKFEAQIEEHIRVRNRLGTRRDFPIELASELAFSKAWIFLWPAYQCYHRGQIRAARRFLHRAITMDRRITVHPEFLGLYARMLLGRRVSHLLRSVKTRLVGEWQG